MLGTKTRQVNAYGRRPSRIVNASDRREPARPPDDPPARENAVVVSPARPRGRKGLQRTSPSAQRRSLHQKATRGSVAKRMQSEPKPGAHLRQPLTPLRHNCTSSSEFSSSGVKGMPARSSLKPHLPVIAVDIVLFDQDGNILTQERRLSRTEIQANLARPVSGRSRKVVDISLANPPPIAISDDSDPEMALPKLVARRPNRRPRAVVISSDESELDEKDLVHKEPSPPLAKSHTRSKSLRVEVVIPIPSCRNPRVAANPPSPPPLALTLPTTPVLPLPAFRPHLTVVPSLLAPPIPIVKPRQLTPIRGSSSRSIFRRPPPTPSTPTEAELSFDLAQLDLSDATEVDDLAPLQPEYLVPLLNECSQTFPYEFSAFVETFPFDPVVQSSAEAEDARFRKIGEASYSEVFGIGNVVLKIIPVRFAEESELPEATEIPAPSDADDVLKEIVATREVGDLCDKFVKLLKTYVVRGKYPSLLLELWDEYNERKGSESIRPDSFGLTQVYAIIILPNGGPDLESFIFKNVSKSGWHQACSIFWQVARALEQAEHVVNFEHRDLHWGQILVKSIPVKKPTHKHPTSRIAMDDTRFGVEITIIDLGLSRMNAADSRGSKVYWTTFDTEIFEGEGDYQYDIYRMMRDIIGGAWRSYHPFTNVMWLHYLVTKLLYEKRLKPPFGKGQAGGGMASLTGYDEQECYDCLVAMEGLLGHCIASARKEQKNGRRTAAPSRGLESARDVVAYGTRRGWVG